MMYLYGVASIPFASFFSFALSRFKKEILYPVALAIPFATLPIHSLKSRACQTDLDRAVSEIISKKKSPIRLYTNELALWGPMATIVSKLYRQGENVCIDKLWGFMFGKDLVCSIKPQLSIEVSSKSEVPSGKEGVSLRKGSLVFDSSS